MRLDTQQPEICWSIGLPSTEPHQTKVSESPSFLDVLAAFSPLQPTTEARQSGVAAVTIMDIVVVSGAAMTDVTQILSQIESGDPDAAEQLLPLVYDELRSSRRKNSPTRSRARLCRRPHWCTKRIFVWWAANQRMPSCELKDRGHFFAAAAEAMRRILVDTARRKKTRKRGGAFQRQPLEAIAVA